MLRIREDFVRGREDSKTARAVDHEHAEPAALVRSLARCDRLRDGQLGALASNASSNGAGGDGTGAGINGSLGAGGSTGVLGGVTAPPQDPTLPPPWQYYAKDSDFGFKDPSLGDDVKDKFGGANDAAGAPTIVYPLDHSMHPMNLQQITFQWSRGKSKARFFASTQ